MAISGRCLGGHVFEGIVRTLTKSTAKMLGLSRRLGTMSRRSLRPIDTTDSNSGPCSLELVLLRK